MRSLDDLMKEAKWGQLTQDELSYVVEKIKNFNEDTDKEDLSDLLYILGRSRAVQYRGLLEKFVRYPLDGWACIRALEGLCRYFDLEKDYVEDLKFYIKGAEWDASDQIRIQAMSLAGRYLREEHDQELLQLLLDVFENLGKVDHIRDVYDEARPLLQSCAYCDLAKAIGKHPLETDLDSVEEAISQGNRDGLDLIVIEKVHQRLRENSKNKGK